MMKQRFFFLFLGVLILPAVSMAQLKRYNFSDLDSLNSIEKRPIVVFMHADWCKFCKQMEHTTLQNDDVMHLLNDRFYFVSFNGEQKEDVEYQGYKFKYKPTGGNTGIHELAEQLGTIDGKVNYPTVSIVNHKNEIVFQHGGLMNASELLIVLREINKL